MRPRALLLLVLLILPFRAEAQPAGWNGPMAGQVFTAAFAFMAPRTLQAIPLANFTLWGLRGLTALDPQVGPALGPKQITLVSHDRPVLVMPLPAPTDAAAWGQLAAAFCAKAVQVSPDIAATGTTGIVTSFFDELFNHLDPYSRYIAPGDSEPAAAPAPGGPGVTLAQERGGPLVTDVDPQGAAAQAGLAAGDRLIAVDGRSTRGQPLDRIASLMSGAPGRTVDLLILPHGARKVRHLRFQLGNATPETVFPAMDRTGILWVQLIAFEHDTAAHLREAINANGDRMRGLVIDLRGDRGGLLDQAVIGARALLDQGTIASTDGRAPGSDQKWAASGGALLPANIPIVVLVDGRTASAAEVLSAALSDNGRAVVVGSTTLGKGLVQAGTALPDGGDLLVTWARLIAPLGWPLQGLGVMPQICTSGGADAVEQVLQDLASGSAAPNAAVRASRTARPGLSVDRILQIRQSCPAALGSDLDTQAAHFLLTNPSAYQAALIR